MNLSTDFMQSERPAKDRVIYGDNRREHNSKMVSDAIYLHRPATRLGISWVRDPCAKTVAQRTFNAKESPGDRRLPPLPQAVVCRDHEPHVIRFVDGEDAPMRKRALETCVSQLGAVRGRKLLLRCKQGELENQLGYVKAWAEKRCARFPARPVVVGIDGIDQWLASPRVAACHLQAILDVGTTVACAVDARYVDSRLLTFQLRVLGIRVKASPVFLLRPRCSASHQTRRAGHSCGVFPMCTPRLWLRTSRSAKIPAHRRRRITRSISGR